MPPIAHHPPSADSCNRRCGSGAFALLACGFFLFPADALAAARTIEGTLPITIREHAIGRDGHRGIRRLEIDADIRFPVAGLWEVDPAISHREEYFGWTMPGTAEPESIFALAPPGAPGRWSANVVTDSLGRARLRLVFKGDELARLGTDGPWHLTISAETVDASGRYHADSTMIARLHAFTGPWVRDHFAKEYRGEFDRFPDWYHSVLGHDMRAGEDIVFTQGWDLFTATVVRADSVGTNAAPPHVTLLVEHVFQGRTKPGTVEATWSVEPLMIPCPVGEEENIRRWNSAPAPSPAVGSRWILGGFFDDHAGRWSSIDRCRWPLDGATFAHFEDAVKRWPRERKELLKLRAKSEGPRIREQRRNEKIARAKRRHDDAVRKVRAAEAAKLEEQRVRALQEKKRAETRRFFTAAQALAATVPIEALVHQSTAIAVGRIDLHGHWPKTRSSSDAPFLVESWLRGEVGHDSITTIRITPREDSVATYWKSAPENRRPVRDQEGPIRAIAFLSRSTLEPRSYVRPTPVWRLVDGSVGLLAADASMVDRVRSAVLADSIDSRTHAETPGASWQDFTGMADGDLGNCALKISPLWAVGTHARAIRSLVLSSPPDTTAKPIPPEYVWPRALPDSAYRVDGQRPALSLSLRANEMRVLLDAVTALAPVRDGRVDVADTMSVTLRRIRGGREIQIERTLDSASIDRLAWLLIGVSIRSTATWDPRIGAATSRDLEPWVADVRPAVFERHAQDVWRARYVRPGPAGPRSH